MAKVWRVSYSDVFAVSYTDRAYPEIVVVGEGGKTFLTAQKELMDHIRQQRDHWAELLRATKALKMGDVK